MSKPNLFNRLFEMVGNLGESLMNDIIKDYKVQELTEHSEKNKWYRLTLPEGKSGDGSEYFIYVKKADSKKFCIFLSGGGIAWDARSAAHSFNGGRALGNLPKYYWSNLRPITQGKNISFGMTRTSLAENPFSDWNMVIIGYSTGDMHVGNGELQYKGKEGEDKTLYFNGYNNFRAAMNRIVEIFKDPEELLICGDSAGAFATPALAMPILKEYYTSCPRVTCFSDSALLINPHWKETIRDCWNAEPFAYDPISTDNNTIDWYRRLYETFGDSINYLYAGSPRDHVLARYYMDMCERDVTLKQSIAYFQMRMAKMAKELKAITPKFGLFQYSFIDSPMEKGTAHTICRTPRFYKPDAGTGVAMSKWLGDAVNGNIYDVGSFENPII
ncbi:MAG: alpha/beta hydrolase fold domain-containing protein [Eubacterium sp.]|nr:alpha/beta hydrolase fold domain-containing protein [Eubacterium sp.]